MNEPVEKKAKSLQKDRASGEREGLSTGQGAIRRMCGLSIKCKQHIKMSKDKMNELKYFCLTI